LLTRLVVIAFNINKLHSLTHSRCIMQASLLYICTALCNYSVFSFYNELLQMKLHEIMRSNHGASAPISKTIHTQFTANRFDEESATNLRELVGALLRRIKTRKKCNLLWLPFLSHLKREKHNKRLQLNSVHQLKRAADGR